MGEDERDRLERLAAELSAEDPSWAEQFTTRPSRRPVRRRWAVLTGLLCAGLVVLAVLTSTVAVALLVIPVVVTAAVVPLARALYADWSAAGGEPRPEP